MPSWLALLARSDVANDVEVTLRAERPVVATEAIPVERVRLGTETVRDEETVSGEVHKGADRSRRRLRHRPPRQPALT